MTVLVQVFFAFTGALVAYNFLKIPYLFDFSKPYTMGRVFGYSFPLASPRWFVILHWAAATGNSLVGVLFGFHLIAEGPAKLWFTALNFVNIPLILMFSGNLGIGTPPAKARFLNCTLLLLANGFNILWLYFNNSAYFVLSVLVQDVVGVTEFVSLARYAKDPALNPAAAAAVSAAAKRQQ